MAFSLWKKIKKIIHENLDPEIEVNLAETIGNKYPDVSPYLLTKFAPNFYHIIVLPKFVGDQLIPEEPLLKFAKRQYDSNDLDTILVLDKQNAVLYHENGTSRTTKIPSNGILCTGMLCTMYGMMSNADFDPTHQLRCDEVKKFIDAQTGTYLLTDFTKGAREATPEERIELSGPNPLYEGVPKGLVKCTVCSQFKGICLYKDAALPNQVVNVHCQCDNHNRCAYCSSLLGEHKLSANRYNEEENAIYHTTGGCGVPEFSDTAHSCSVELRG